MSNIKLFMKQNVAQVACTKILAVRVLKLNTVHWTLSLARWHTLITVCLSKHICLKTVFHFDYSWIVSCGITNYKEPTLLVNGISKVIELQETVLRIAHQIYQTLKQFYTSIFKILPSCKSSARYKKITCEKIII